MKETYTKIIVGYVCQKYQKQEDGTFICIGQGFIAGDDVSREDNYGEKIDDTNIVDNEDYFPLNMMQPKNKD
jgi:hypothetical protein